jgi:NAD(P)-dependent dehydrogenase (short-subunit alcohol dehydrogenase family)
MSAKHLFSLDNKVAVITGGAGMLGKQHAIAIHSFGGIPILADLNLPAAKRVATEVGSRAIAVKLDVTSEQSVRRATKSILKSFGKVDILINNAARDAKVVKSGMTSGRFEDFDLAIWNLDLAVGLTGAALCSRYFGEAMADQKNGVILNIASDLALIGPNQSLYEKTGLPPVEQPKKPASYCVTKSGMIGLTRYLATYWAQSNVRVNALCPGGVFSEQSPEFMERISKLIPMSRMANVDEYQGAVVFLCSDASSYMTGSIISIDGGRTCW